MQVAQYVKGGWIQEFRPSAYRFPNSDKILDDAVEAAGPTLGPVLLSVSEFLMSSFNESYQSRCVEPNLKFFLLRKFIAFPYHTSPLPLFIGLLKMRFSRVSPILIFSLNFVSNVICLQ